MLSPCAANGSIFSAISSAFSPNVWKNCAQPSRPRQFPAQGIALGPSKSSLRLGIEKVQDGRQVTATECVIEFLDQTNIGFFTHVDSFSLRSYRYSSLTLGRPAVGIAITGVAMTVYIRPPPAHPQKLTSRHPP